ncbi:energy-coupling factor transporter transmembrane component T family protein, partial [Thauera linaloolentis]
AAAAGALVLAAAMWRGGAWRPLLGRLLAVNGFVAMLWLTLPWQFGADGIAASAAGRELALQISLRTNAIALCCLGLLSGLDAFAIGRAAAGLGLPPKMARLLTLTVRYFDLLAASRQRIERAMQARGFRPGMNRRTLRVHAQLVALLLVHAMLRAERVGLALRARGFRA